VGSPKVVPCARCGYNQGKQPVLWTWALRDELLAPSRLEHRERAPALAEQSSPELPECQESRKGSV
jgi:hypothetical protein